jgi:predicted ATPase/DNA-binding SARP family transcriptional activator
MSHLRLFLFGSPRLERDGTVLAMDTRKAIALLAYLALTGQVHSRDTLAALLWPEYGQGQARGSLRRTLSTLTKAIGKESLEIDRENIGLVAGDGLWVDVRRFQELLAASSSHDHPAETICRSCLTLLSEVLALYQGEFMAGFNLADSPTFEEWQFFQRESLRREIADVLDKLVCGYSQRGQFSEAIALARRWVALDPLDETAERWLMRLYAWTGQRSAALRQYQQLVRLLDEELGISPDEETEALHWAIEENQLWPPAQASGEAAVHPADERDSSAQLSSFAISPHNLPAQTTAFVGRETELTALTGLLADPDCRLLTLVGPGGVGKTRLAIEVAAHRQESVADGVCFVSLAPTSNASFISAAIANALGLSLHGSDNPASQLLDYLRQKQLLLVLDNLEHLLAPGSQAFALLADLLHQAPQVKLLVTSRQRLQLQGEWVFEIQGLPLPQPGSGFEVYSAVNLFIQSACRVDRRFKLAPADQPAVARICRLVDGTPLGIELAAAWVHLLSCAEIAAEIERNLDFLTVAGPDLPERHRSLRAAFNHSWNLLSTEERQVLGRLSVFQGGFGREAAQQVTGASLANLSALVDKSLLHRTGRGRYDLHQLVHQYTKAHLQAKPSMLGDARQRHSDYYLSLLARKEIDIKGAQQPAVVAELSSEIGNLRLAWQWAVTHGQIEAIRSAFPTLLIFFEVRSWFQLGVTFFEQAVEGLRASAAKLLSDAGRAGGEPQRWRLCLAEMKMGQGFFLFRRGRAGSEPDSVKTNPTAGRAICLLNESLALLEPLGEPRTLAYAQLCRGVAGYTMGDFQEAQTILLTGLAISRSLGDKWLTAVHLGHLGMIAYSVGEWGEAERRLAESVPLWREVGDVRGLVFNLSIYGMVSAQTGAIERARQLLDESLLISGQNNDRWGVANAFNYLGQIALEQEPPELEAAHYFLAESATIFKDLGARWLLVSVLNNLGQIAATQQSIGEAKKVFLEALDMAVTDPILPAAMEALAGLAELLMQEGETCRAAEMIAQVMNHPASSQHSRDKAKRLWLALETQLSTDQMESLMTRESGQSLQMIAARLHNGHVR